MARNGFFDVPRAPSRTSEGKVDLPIFFHDAAVRQLNYWVGYDRVLPKLAGTGLVPCRFFNGKALVSLIFFQYRDVSIGPYDEVTVTVIVRPEMLEEPLFYLPNFLRKKGASWKNIGAYVLEMPVTSFTARAAGRELWGYPKFITTIPYRLEGPVFEYVVLDPDTGESIVSVKGRMGAGIPLRGFDLVTYSNHGDAIWKTIIDVDAVSINCRGKGTEVKVGPSRHGMANNIRDLGLEDLQPFIIQGTDSFRSRLNAGTPVAPWKTPPLPYPPEKKRKTGKGTKKGGRGR